MKLYGGALSPFFRKARVVLEEKGIPYQIQALVPVPKTPELLAMHPMGKIPILRDGDVVVPDSSVICAYLERLHPAPALYPAEPRAYAKALWLEEYADGTVFREVVHGLFFQKVIRPNVLKQGSDQAAIAAIENQALPKAFGHLESAAAAGELGADRFGIAEIAVTCNLVNFHYLGYTIDARRYPKLAAFFKRQTALPAMAAALAAEQPVAAQMGLDQSFMSTAAAA